MSEISKKFMANYRSSTPPALQIVDAYLCYLVVVGVLLFCYVLLVGEYPFNAFLAAFGSTCASFSIGAGLRMQSTPSNQKLFNITQETYIFSNIVPLNTF